MPNKIYQAPEATRTWTDAATGGDELLDLGGLAADAGRVGSAWDRGSASRPEVYAWQLFIDGFDTAPVVGETIDIYIAESDGTITDGPVGFSDTADSALASTNLLKNLRFIGQAVVRSTTAGDDLVASGRIALSLRHVIPVIHNNTADALLSTSDAHKFILTPLPPEIQD